MGNSFSLWRQKRCSNVVLPCKLIEEILCKLPVKSLLRFQTVCKSWNLLINSHVFISRHLNRKNPQLGGYPIAKKKERTIFPVDIGYLVDVCNGIICLETTSYEKSLILFNPSTREFSFVPHDAPQSFFGFCYNPKSQEYLIVCFYARGPHPGGYRKIDITTLTLGKTISRVDKKVRSPGQFTDLRHVTSGTTMYWLGAAHDDCYNEMVVCYDVIESRFREMNMPPISFDSYNCKSLRLLKGSVIMFVSPTYGRNFFDIWMLIDDVSNGKDWMKYQTVGPLETVVLPIEVCWYDRWILCEKGGGKGLFYYDLETNQVKDYCDLHSDQVVYSEAPTLEFANYVESLVSISSLVPCIDVVPS